MQQVLGKMNNDGRLPGVSVVIPAYYPGLLFKEVLDSALNLDYPKNLLELLVVCVPSDILVRNIVRKSISESGMNVRLLIIDSRIASVRRNYGIKNSCYDIVLISDDDIVLHKQTILRSARMIVNDSNVGAVAYSVIGDGSRLIDRIYHMKFIDSRLQQISTVTACTVFNKHALLEAGLYREDMGPPLGIHEDWELGSRIRKKGFKLLIDGSVYSKHLYASRETAPITTNGKNYSPRRNLAASYVSGAKKNYRTFFIVLRSGGLTQKLEYTLYFLIPLMTLSLLFVSVYSAAILVGLAVAVIEINCFVQRQYRMLSVFDRTLYPLVTLIVRIVRTYLAVFFLLVHYTHFQQRHPK